MRRSAAQVVQLGDTHIRAELQSLGFSGYESPIHIEVKMPKPFRSDVAYSPDKVTAPRHEGVRPFRRAIAVVSVSEVPLPRGFDQSHVPSGRLDKFVIADQAVERQPRPFIEGPAQGTADADIFLHEDHRPVFWQMFLPCLVSLEVAPVYNHNARRGAAHFLEAFDRGTALIGAIVGGNNPQLKYS